MNSYYIDFEFIEGFRKLPLIGRKQFHTIEMISVGIISGDKRTYDAISSEYDYHHASDWVKTNVIGPLYRREVSGDQRNRYGEYNFHRGYGQSNVSIAEEIKDFVGDNPIFYGYFADYDWVLLCSLYGTMMDLPRGWPMYCIDLKQILDEKVQALPLTIPRIYNFEESKHNNFGTDLYASFAEKLAYVKAMAEYPEDDLSHDALADADWNRRLHNFIIGPLDHFALQIQLEN